MPAASIVCLCTAVCHCQQVGGLSAGSFPPMGNEGEGGGQSEDRWEGGKTRERLYNRIKEEKESEE